MNSMILSLALLPTTSANGHEVSIFYRWKEIFVAGYLIQFLQYTFTAGLAFLIFYALMKRFFSGRKIQAVFPRSADVRREIVYSLQSLAVFAAVGVLSSVLERLHWAQIYYHIHLYGWGYFFFSIVALIVLHDTWFYWTHRALHWRPLFRLAHRVHHQSHNPTPWAAFAFHPIEALIEALIYPAAILVLPIHPLAALAWLLYMTVMNVGGHLGFELCPPGFARHRLFRWHNTSVHHNMHHSHIHCNYGLYFNIWDRLMGTNHAKYEEYFDQVVVSAGNSVTSLPVLPATKLENNQSF